MSREQAKRLRDDWKEHLEMNKRDERRKILDEIRQRQNKIQMLYRMKPVISPKIRVMEIEIEKKKIRELMIKLEKLPTLEVSLRVEAENNFTL